MSCNMTRFYFCQSDITIQEFIKRDLRMRMGIAFDDVETTEADAYEAKLIEEGEDYLRVDL
jgi:hypothetical protein